MHPGNIFVRSDGNLVPIDFGIMGYLDFHDRLFLARLLRAMLDRDYDEVATFTKNLACLERLYQFINFPIGSCRG